MTTTATTRERPPASLPRRLAVWLFAHRRLQLGLLLLLPFGWLAVVYLGSLFILLLSALWAQDTFTGNVTPFAWTLRAFEILLEARSIGRSPSGRSGWPRSSP